VDQRARAHAGGRGADHRDFGHAPARPRGENAVILAGAGGAAADPRADSGERRGVRGGGRGGRVRREGRRRRRKGPGGDEAGGVENACGVFVGERREDY